MKKKCLVLIWTYTVLFTQCQEYKIVGLVPVRNEQIFITQCLKALSLYTDAIIVLDDYSTDNTVEIIESLTEECNIERIIKKKSWYRDEPGDKNKMLQAGREIGGTHFVWVDADEMLTANCLNNNFLRSKIFSLRRGEKLALNWIALWRSHEQYRFDNSVWTWNYRACIFHDDGKCSYSSEFMHTPHIPRNLRGTCHRINGYTYGVLHFQFINWRNLLIKQAWYRCLERIRLPQRPVSKINARYAPSKDERNLHVKPSPTNWFAGYDFFDPSALAIPEQWREKQVLGWFRKYGKEYFAGLDIWDVDWGKS